MWLQCCFPSEIPGLPLEVVHMSTHGCDAGCDARLRQDLSSRSSLQFIPIRDQEGFTMRWHKALCFPFIIPFLSCSFLFHPFLSLIYVLIWSAWCPWHGNNSEKVLALQLPRVWKAFQGSSVCYRAAGKCVGSLDPAREVKYSRTIQNNVIKHRALILTGSSTDVHLTNKSRILGQAVKAKTLAQVCSHRS